MTLLELNVTDPPIQNEVGPDGVMVGVGGIGFTVTTASVLKAVAHGPFCTIA